MTDDVPWRLERPALDQEQVRAIIREQFPAIRAARIELLGEGWDNEAWLVDASLVFRFPKRADVQTTLAREEALLPLLAERLAVAVPQLEWIGSPGERFPFRFSAYRLIGGTARDWSRRPPGGVLPAFENSLARLLNGIHGATAAARAVLDAHGVSHAPEHAGIDWFEELDRVRSRVTDFLDPATVNRITALLDGDLVAPPAYAGEPVFLHHDLAGDHLLLDEDDGRIEGVIDWADAGFGDPAGDFIEPTIWLGPGFLARALQRYEHPIDDGFLDRVRHGASLIVLLNLGFALERNEQALAAGIARHLETVMLPNGEFLGR